MNWLSGFITRLSSIVFNEFVIQCQDPKPGTHGERYDCQLSCGLVDAGRLTQSTFFWLAAR